MNKWLQCKHDNDSIRQLIADYANDPNNTILIQAIEEANTSQVTDMSNLFDDENYDSSVENFNLKIGNWNTSKVTDMSYMFRYAKLFNQVLNFDTSSVNDMSGMFEYTQLFNNLDLDLNFKTSNVTNMEVMFRCTQSFNQSLNFDISNVTKMSYMFDYAESFDQNLAEFILTVKDKDLLESIEEYIKPIKASEYLNNINKLSKKEQFELLSKYKRLKDNNLIISKPHGAMLHDVNDIETKRSLDYE